MAVEIPGYRIDRVLGKGGMATVYLAVQKIFERHVALKVMSTALAEDPSFGQRFLREARIVSQLVHPNIITVYDVGVHDNAYYLSMEYIAGPDLKQARQQLTLAQKIQVVLDIAKALDFAGSKGYVHRDIKPENILLRQDTYRAVLMDFGIARAAETDLSVTQTGMALGTPHYMSPEQAKGQAVDHRSDLYSLGVVFYYLLVGVVPYHADSAVAIGIKHITEPVPTLPPPLRSLQPLIDKLMAKVPSERYQTAAGLITQLQGLDIQHLERAQRAYEQAQKEAPGADPIAATHIHSAVSEIPAAPANGPAGETTHITRLTRVVDLFWQYKLLAGSAVVMLFVTVVIVKRPFRAPMPAPAVTAEAMAVAPQVDASPVARAADLAEDEFAEDAPDAPSYAGAPATEIRLADLTGPEYRRAQQPDTSAQARPVELLTRLQRRLQEVSGRAPMREITLAEKVAELRAALQRDPRDSEAQKRLAWLAGEYFRTANDFFSEGDFASAQQALDTGRNLFPEYRGAYQPLAKRLAERGRLERLLAKAQTQAAAGRLVSPWRNNALHYYRSALRIDGELAVAQRGIRDVERALMAHAREHWSAGNSSAATHAAEEVLKINPESQEARQFLLKLEQRAGSEPTVPAPETRPANATQRRSVSLREGVPVASAPAEGPRIEQLRVDGKLVSGMNAHQLQVVPRQKTLFFSFEYKDFPRGQTQLEAELFDADGKRLVKVPVTLVEASGIQRFRVERREPFPAGEYQLNLALEGTALMRAGFLLQ